MGRISSDPLAPSEWKVMKIVWQLKSCVARDVYTWAGEEFGWTPNTVRTILSRLVDKGFLKTTQVANCYVYRPARSFSSTLFEAADDLLGKTVAGRTGPLLSYMIKQSPLSKEEIAELRSLLDQREEEHETGGSEQ